MNDSVIEQVARQYNLSGWSEGLFRIDDRGRLCRDGVALSGILDALRARGYDTPILLRFHDVLEARLQRLQAAFDAARARHGYAADYAPVYPIKVNQQRSVVARLQAAGGGRLGLECGSKAELLAVLAMSPPGGTVICNGYKDREYIRLALAGRRLGLKPWIVVEKPSELELVLQESSALDIEPLLGVRVRLATLGEGKWQNSGGEFSKFGLSAAQLMALCERLRAAGRLHHLRLMHFHMGSQLANLADIRRGLREAARHHAELRRLGAPIEVLDVGGGLGVDYEGTRSRSFCSMNYRLEDYAETVVATLAEGCRRHGLPQPALITEAGRAMTAHHAVLVTSVIDREVAESTLPPEPGPEAPAQLRGLWRLLQDDDMLADERHATARDQLEELELAYSDGRAGLAERAAAEALYRAICARILAQGGGLDATLRDALQLRLADKLFCNFSVFQSVPDVWAFDQIFPIVPLRRLDERPTRRAVLQDLTCDSDGHIEHYVDGAGIERSLPVHETAPGEDYPLGIFMVGAYQEILGDLHNLFGDTHAADVRVQGDDWTLLGVEPGDCVAELLRIVHYDVDRLRARLRQLAADDAALARILEQGLDGYTYHEDLQSSKLGALERRDGRARQEGSL